jgi:hypothetical protein
MVVYQVTITLRSEIEAGWLEWMRDHHVPEVLRTGCFRRCVMARADEPIGDEVTYVFRYECDSKAAYERYRREFAPAMQKEHTERYAGKFRGSRMVLEEVAVLEAPK